LRLHYAIVLNPTADKGAAGKRITEIKKLMERDKMDFRIHQTERPGHAIELRKTLSRNADTAIIAAGGDGTCNEIINGLLASHRKRDKPLIGVLPFGRNNDFAYAVGLPEGLEASMDTLLTNQITPLDVGWISGGDYPKGRWFGNGLGVCFNAATIANIHNAAAYPLAAIKSETPGCFAGGIVGGRKSIEYQSRPHFSNEWKTLGRFVSHRSAWPRCCRSNPERKYGDIASNPEQEGYVQFK